MAVSHGYSDHSVLRSPVVPLSSHRPTITFSVPFNDFHRLHTAISKPKFLSYNLLPGVSSKPRMSSSISPAIQNPLIESLKTPNPFEGLLSGSTQTVTALGPAFFAAMKNVPTGSLNTPFTVVAVGMAKWLDLYSGVLMVRLLLSWFPNVQWDRQPLSAIRD